MPSGTRTHTGETVVIESKFEQAKHGLPYRNGSFAFHVGPVSFSVLCGNISHTAMDYFLTKAKPPTLAKTPAEGNPMQEYLYARQSTAHYYTWHRFAAAWGGALPVLASGISNAIMQDDINELATYLASEPVIVCLYGGPGTGHRVVAYAADLGQNEISIFDSNYPDRTSTIKYKKGGVFEGDWVHTCAAGACAGSGRPAATCRSARPAACTSHRRSTGTTRTSASPRAAPARPGGGGATPAPACSGRRGPSGGSAWTGRTPRSPARATSWISGRSDDTTGEPRTAATRSPP